MELLDATIALAVTLAALATAVTVIMEIFVRIIGNPLTAWTATAAIQTINQAMCINDRLAKNPLDCPKF
jgi:hypothetical protein